MNTITMFRLNRTALTRVHTLYVKQTFRRIHREATIQELMGPSPSVIDKAKAMSKELGAQFSTGFKDLYRNSKKTFTEYNQKKKDKKQLSRYELRFINRTREDLMCLIPFGLFSLLPGSTALLPVFIQMFPHLLPSTFHTQAVKDKTLERMRLTSLSGYQGAHLTLVQKLVEIEHSNNVTSQEKELAKGLFKKVSIHDATELKKYVPLFSESGLLSINNLSRTDVTRLCDHLGLLPYFPTFMLKNNLKHWVYKMNVDDWAIRKEGIDSLPDDDYSACVDRRLIFKLNDKTSKEARKQALSKWLDTLPSLSIPSSQKITSVPDYVAKEVNKEKDSSDVSAYLWGAVLLTLKK